MRLATHRLSSSEWAAIKMVGVYAWYRAKHPEVAVVTIKDEDDALVVRGYRLTVLDTSANA